MQIANINVWTDPSKTVIPFAMLKLQYISEHKI